MTSANISDPEVIRDFRSHLANFLKLSSAALGGRASDLNRARDWLRTEQLPHWKSQQFRREETYQNARRLWLEAEAAVVEGMTGRGPGKASSIEERVDMDKARRRRDEADEKLALVRRWLVRLDQDGEPLMQACQGHDFDIKDRGARALAQLDHLVESVQSYLDLKAGGSGPMPAAPGSAAGASGPALAAGSAEPHPATATSAESDDPAGGGPCPA
ncbi:MAG: hypothetical protein H0W83_03560 [Planctomycetes bacterium]|nr:hypothetical protein [Planctomycetota bacterium]